jgi:hypothetical protein
MLALGSTILMIGLFSASFQLFRNWLVESSNAGNGDLDV